ncbi:hypothetical protein HOL21_01905 [Candidatus Woesearchaeota archaeon]|jgi:hypothetical protein|nr:hypothetical protein [Candidatus Woesearchaeota archaeon]MBT5396947.1 hypothetical protein [Candidatus Woesearchaeota archaeon]MBT5924160.1 hypothetical protein [Candidatus Woesearchaeota archaeon]MBT6367140.1 hypothetical protein [Candidatus Woesearchaeota archaeon]
MPIINPELLIKIDSAKQKLDEEKLDTFVDDLFRNMQRQVIKFTSTQDGDNARRRDEVIETFRNAWEYGKINYKGDFNLVLLSDIAGKVEPNLCHPGERHVRYRSSSATLNELGYVAPIDRNRIHTHLERTLEAMKTMTLHPVEEAIYLYSQIVRIQPFDNGNKRTGNIIMNLTLNQEGFPTVFVRPEERSVYISLLGNALTGFQEGGANGEPLTPYTKPDYRQVAFNDHFANKVLTSLLCSRNNLKSLPRYRISMQTKYQGLTYSAKNALSGWFSKREQVNQVQLKPRQKEITITGQIPYETINHIMKDISNGKMKYRIETL